MSINFAKRWLAVDRGCRFALFTDYPFIKKGYSVVLFIFYSKGYVESNSENVLDIMVN